MCEIYKIVKNLMFKRVKMPTVLQTNHFATCCTHDSWFQKINVPIKLIWTHYFLRASAQFWDYLSAWSCCACPFCFVRIEYQSKWINEDMNMLFFSREKTITFGSFLGPVGSEAKTSFGEYVQTFGIHRAFHYALVHKWMRWTIQPSQVIRNSGHDICLLIVFFTRRPLKKNTNWVALLW